MPLDRGCVFLAHSSAHAHAVSARAAAKFGFDAYDCDVILLAGDAGEALEVRAMLQSLGCEVLSGANFLNAHNVPVVVVLKGFLDRQENRLQFDKIRRRWPFGPVISVSDPADVESQLIRILS